MKAKRYEITFRWLKRHCWYARYYCGKLSYDFREDISRCTEANCPLLKRRKVVE